MGLRTRLNAAFDAFRGNVPPPKSEQNPYFYNFSASMLGMPSQNQQISYQQLRAFSESAIVRRAIDYIRSQITRLDWDITVIHGTKVTAAQRKKIDTVKSVLRTPNREDTFNTWLGQMVEDMLVIGLGVSEIKPWSTSTATQPYLLYPVDAASIQIYLDWDGNPAANRYAQFDMHGNRIDFKARDMFVVRHNPRSNTPFGLSPTEVAVQQIQYLLDAQVYAGKTASLSVPKKLLWMGEQIDERKLQEFRLYFRNEIEGRSHIPITGGHDAPTSIELGAASDEALFLQWQSFLIAIIANAFNLDAMKFNAFVGINRSTGDALDDTSDESAIRPMARSIEDAINHHFLNYFGLSDVAEFRFRFTTSYQDRKSLAVIHQIYAQADIITINEARRELGLPDLPKDDRLGHSKGDLTLSEYRGIFGAIVTLQDAVGIDEDTDTPGMLSIQQQNADTEKQNADTKRDAVSTKVNNQNGNGGNNGVHGTPNPKPAANNQRTDKGTNVSL